MRRTTLTISIIWLALVAGSLLWNLWYTTQAQQSFMLDTARTISANVFLAHNAGTSPAGVLDALSALPATAAGPTSRDATRTPSPTGDERMPSPHITRLNLVPPPATLGNDEQQALARLHQGAAEVGRVRGDAFLYVAPLKADDGCTDCRTTENTQGNDSAAAVSITLPVAHQIPVLSLSIGHSVIGLFGLLGIVFYGRKLEGAYETIRLQSTIDELTGIPNRRSLSAHLLREFDQCRRYQQCLTLIMCDIDHFKAYNDTYGHKAGDECLRKVAGAIQGTLVRPRDFCGRYGGEEFVVALPDTDQDGGLHVAEKIRQNILDLGIMHRNGTPVKQVTISLGLATDQARALSSYDILLEQSDRALYVAKNRGRNQLQVFSVDTGPDSQHANPCLHDGISPAG